MGARRFMLEPKNKRRDANTLGDTDDAGQIQPLLVSKKTSAQLLDISPRNVTYLISSKQLACRRIGRRTLVPYSALVKFAQRDHPVPQKRRTAETQSSGDKQ